jgi:hypothetical protein
VAAVGEGLQQQLLHLWYLHKQLLCRPSCSAALSTRSSACASSGALGPLCIVAAYVMNAAPSCLVAGAHTCCHRLLRCCHLLLGFQQRRSVVGNTSCSSRSSRYSICEQREGQALQRAIQYRIVPSYAVSPTFIDYVPLHSLRVLLLQLLA